MSDEPTYLTLDDLVAAIAIMPDGPVEVRDYGLLESAIARPATTVAGLDAYPSIPAKGAALVHSLVRNHALVDGNKRLGLIGLELFYRLNDHRFTATEDQAVQLILDVASGQLDDVTVLASKLAAYTAPA